MQLNSTFAVWLRARATAARAIATTSSAPRRSWWARWISELDRNTWMRGLRARRIASQVASTSSGTARASAHTQASRTWAATAATDARSPGDETGKPASITSTFIASSSSAISTLAFLEKNTPAACSPSRSVVSNTVTRSECMVTSVRIPQPLDPGEVARFATVAVRGQKKTSPAVAAGEVRSAFARALAEERGADPTRLAKEEAAKAEQGVGPRLHDPRSLEGVAARVKRSPEPCTRRGGRPLRPSLGCASLRALRACVRTCRRASK